MRESPPGKSNADTDDLSQADRVDQICDAYERAWLEGSRPRLEDYLARAPDAEQENLRQELQAICSD